MKSSLKSLLIGGIIAFYGNLWGQSDLKQVIPYSFPGVITDTAYVYQNSFVPFRPFRAGNVYFTAQYSHPNPRFGLGYSHVYSPKSDWFLYTNLEYIATFASFMDYDGNRGTFALSLPAIRELLGFSGSAVYAHVYSRKLRANTGYASVAYRSRGNTSTNYMIKFDNGTSVFKTWRLGLSQNQNTRGRYGSYDTESNFLGFRYQALRLGVGRTAGEGTVMRLKKRDGRTAEVSLSSSYIDLLLPVAHQNLYTGLLNGGDRLSVRYLPGCEMGFSERVVARGVSTRNWYSEFFAGIHPVQYRTKFSFYAGLRVKLGGGAHLPSESLALLNK